jgi:radical SAM superfamily enzyme YgiQ (UPF0313 family)
MKIIFVAVPYLETDQPIMAPAVLKSIAESQGHESIGIDINVEVRNEILTYPADVSEKLINFLIHKNLDDKSLAKIIYSMVDKQASKLLSHNPDVVGLSLLSWQGQVFAQLLATALKRRKPGLEIIIGGPGIKHELMTSDTTYCEGLKKRGIVDHYIVGDGEQALIEYLNGNFTYPGIDSNHWIELNDLDKWPCPDYSDYDFSAYQGSLGKVRIPIADSRGCVRTCEFCDIIEHWKKYRYRSADSLWQEMLHQINKHGMTNFLFNNALTNGNMKVFNQLLDLMVEYNTGLPEDKQISWSGYFIVRSSTQHPEELWKKLSASNATLMLGVESAVQRVRYEMGKKFDNEDIDWHLEMGQKYQVPFLLLMIVAYPSETIEDFEFTKQWFKDRLKYAQNSVTGVMLTYSAIIPDTALARKAEEYDIALGKYPTVWFNKRLGISAEIKTQYMQELVDICAPFNQGAVLQETIKSLILSNINPAKEFAHEIE